MLANVCFWSCLPNALACTFLVLWYSVRAADPVISIACCYHQIAKFVTYLSSDDAHVITGSIHLIDCGASLKM